MLNVFVLTIIVACMIYVILSISEVSNFHMTNTREEQVDQTNLRTVQSILKERSPTAVRLYIETPSGDLDFLWQGLSSQIIGEYSSDIYPYKNYGSYKVLQELPESNAANIQLVVRIPDKEV